MAFILLYEPFNGHKALTMSYESALLIEHVQKGLIKGTPQQKAFCKNVKKIYFGRKQYEPVEQGRLPYKDNDVI